MRTVDIGELENHVAEYLQHVRNGEEILIQDQDKPIARLLPMPDETWPHDFATQQAALVAAGRLTLPENPQPIDWEAFWAMPKINVSKEVIVQALIDSRGDR
jgi:antitoxin (DNA-binding transcriptional repressor) of toxin-antitoxin stability system